jgi:superfamily II DNA or RNA helicase
MVVPLQIGTVMTADYRTLDFAPDYSTSGSGLLNEFLIPALENAISYDRAAGYFASSVLALVPIALSDFALRGGKIRLLCSPNLSEEDALALLDLPRDLQPSPVEIAALALKELLAASPIQSAAARCLRALLDAGVMEIKFATPRYGGGLFHDKMGIFSDVRDDRIVFVGSANETAAAWSGHMNHEQIVVFREWRPEDSARCAAMAQQFDEMWLGLRRGLVITQASEAAAIVRRIVPSEPLSEILDELRTLAENIDHVDESLSLRNYQRSVLDDWHAHGDRGIVAFATGGGKTRTALEAIREWTSTGRPAVVLVPSALLHDQWTVELETLIPEANLLRVGGGSSKSKWEPWLSRYTMDRAEMGARVVVATYDSAATDTFLTHVNEGDHLLVVADEVHSIGASNRQRIMTGVEAGGRLGLSATPERFGDPAGTRRILDYFGAILQPEFGIAEALDAGVLVPYEYGFRTCALSEEEEDKWNEWSSKIAKDIARNRGEISDRARLMLIQRARISKSAHGKAAIAKELIKAEYSKGDRWLVYCGDVEHLRTVRAELEDLGLDLLEYHSRLDGNKDAVLDYFQARGGVLLAVKCLDEGVDIPLINRAIVLASSTNPREYIQRRGRVLRRAPGKYGARIFDVIVTRRAGEPVTPTEVVRAMEFARHADNVAPLVYLEQLVSVDDVDEWGVDSRDVEVDEYE